MTSAVLDEAIKKAALVWVSVSDGPAYALWCMPLDGALLVISGPGEQQAPGLAEATRVAVRLRGDHGGLIVVAEMTAQRLTPGTDDWATAAPQLAAKRLNASGSADELVARWAADGCVLTRLASAETPALTGAELPDDEAAAPPRDTPARIPPPRPFRLHKVRRR